jgi:hypothetical protein
LVSIEIGHVFIELYCLPSHNKTHTSPEFFMRAQFVKRLIDVYAQSESLMAKQKFVRDRCKEQISIL